MISVIHRVWWLISLYLHNLLKIVGWWFVSQDVVGMFWRWEGLLGLVLHL
jgi:hypothetical protein